MAFETVQIRSTKTPPGSVVTGWRQDLAVGDVLVFSLTSNVGVSSFRWSLIGRPEGSVAGGAGPEPCSLGTGATASFTVDSDAGFAKDGTYIVECIINEGSPSETRKTVGVARLSGLETADGRVLRMMGGFETSEDTADAQVRQGYNKMLERWLRFLVEGGGSAPLPGAVGGDFYDPDSWYHWGFRPSDTGRDWATDFIAPLEANRLITHPHVFTRPGTITHMMRIWVASTRSVQFFAYTPDPANPDLPLTRVYASAVITPGTGFAVIATQVTPNLVVSAGDVLFAGAWESAANPDGATTVTQTGRPAFAGGLQDPADLPNTQGLSVFRVGYRPAPAFGGGAPNPFPAVALPYRTSADVLRSNSGAFATTLFRFAQS